jgi:hypothetical protein
MGDFLPILYISVVFVSHWVCHFLNYVYLVLLCVPRLLFKNVKLRIYRTLSLPVALYGCKTWSLASRKKHRLRVFQHMVPRRMFEPKRDSV